MKIRLALLLVVTVAAAGCADPAESTMPGTVAVELRPAVAVDASQLDAAAAVLVTRVTEMQLDVGVRTAPDGVVLDVRSDLDVAAILDLLLVPGRVSFVAVPRAASPPNDGAAVDPAWPLILGEAAIDRAATIVGSNPVDDTPVIEIGLLPPAADVFEDWTGAHIGEFIVIALDGRALSAPQIQDVIPGGRVMIQSGNGGFELADARRIVALMKSGPLLVDLRR